MDTTVSPRIKLFALVGGLAAAALAGGMFFLTRQPAVDDTPLPPPAIHTPAKVATARPKPAAKAKPKPRAASVIAPNGLPVAVAKQLSDHRVVVVSVYAPGAVDTLARDEARAGARDARAGFAAVDVSDKRLALALAGRTKQLSAPGVLVFERSAGVIGRLNGFADRTLVAQLATSAR